MKNILLTLLLLLTAIIPAVAADFGVTVDSSYGISFNTKTAVDWEDANYSVKASLWANSKMGDDITLEMQGSYTFNQDRTFFVEFDRLEISGKFVGDQEGDGVVSLNLGRMIFSEFSGKVFSHMGDGFKVKYTLPSVSIETYLFYTGLLQSPSSSINLNISDELAQNPVEIPLFGPAATPRLIEGIQITLPELFAQQTIILSGVFQQDFRSETELNENLDNSINTIHAGFGISGAIPALKSFFYTLYGYGNTGWYGDVTMLAFLAGGSINYFIPQLASSRIMIEGLYSSGDADYESVFFQGNTSGYDTAFKPLTPSAGGTVFSAQQTNLFYGSLSYSLKPFTSSRSLTLKNILLLAKGTAFFRSTTGVIYETEIDSEETGKYLGTEIDLNIMMRLLSDLGFSINSGIFFPSDILNSVPQIQATAALSLTI